MYVNMYIQRPCIYVCRYPFLTKITVRWSLYGDLVYFARPIPTLQNAHLFLTRFELAILQVKNMHVSQKFLKLWKPWRRENHENRENQNRENRERRENRENRENSRDFPIWPWKRPMAVEMAYGHVFSRFVDESAMYALYVIERFTRSRSARCVEERRDRV